jgi:hypothetical protein
MRTQNGRMNKKDILFFNKKLKYTFHKSTPTTQFVQRVQLSSVGGMNCNREVLCGGIIEDS